ncbi:MAG: hypothetical protein AAGE93_18410 [Bacteroidota bacterium]
MQVLINSMFVLNMLYFTTTLVEGAVLIADESVPKEVAEQAQCYAQLLALDQHVYIAISFSRDLPPGVDGYTRYQNTESYNEGHQIRIVINANINRAQQIRVLAHEMIHAKQFVEGRLVRCSTGHYSWERGVCTDTKHLPYYNRPWEKEAFKLGNQLYYTYTK